jgi:transcriptional regulator of arginine metabolism
MPSSREVQERRREAIRAILMAEEPPIAEQKDLVELLKSRGIPATQSSVSRDLRELGAVRWDGRYQILDWEGGESPLRNARGLVLKIMKVEPQQILIVTRPGGGGFVGEAVEACGFEDVVGTIAGYSSVLVFTENKFFLDVVWDHLKDHLGEEREEEKKAAKTEE